MVYFKSTFWHAYFDFYFYKYIYIYIYIYTHTHVYVIMYKEGFGLLISCKLCIIYIRKIRML